MTLNPGLENCVFESRVGPALQKAISFAPLPVFVTMLGPRRKATLAEGEPIAVTDLSCCRSHQSFFQNITQPRHKCSKQYPILVTNYNSESSLSHSSLLRNFSPPHIPRCFQVCFLLPCHKVAAYLFIGDFSKETQFMDHSAFKCSFQPCLKRPRCT